MDPVPAPAPVPVPVPVPDIPPVPVPVVISTGQISKKEVIIACVILALLIGAAIYVANQKPEPKPVT